MISSPSPILLTFNMPPNSFVSSYRSIDESDGNLYSWRKSNPLPTAISTAIDFSPSRMYIMTEDIPSREHRGWSCSGQWNWKDAPYRVKERMIKELVKSHLQYNKKKGKVGNSWVIDGPHDVSSLDGGHSHIWLCADFSYCEVKGKDGIVVNISRKVQSSINLWEEKNRGLLFEGTKHLRVKVAVSNDPNRMDGKEFVEWTQDNLHVPAYDGSDISVGEYWKQKGHHYSDEDMNTIKVVNVKSFGKIQKYPSDKVFRVMTMDQWSPEIRQSMKQYLGLKPQDYISYVRKAMRWLADWNWKNRITGTEYKVSDMNFGWTDSPDVKFFDSRAGLFLPNGEKLLNEKWRLNHHLRNFEQLHDGRPPPSIDVYFSTPVDFEHLIPQLKQHAIEIFKQIPGWADRVNYASSFLIPSHSQLAAENSVNDFIQSIPNTGRSAVIFSALPPKSTKQTVDLYKCLKYITDTKKIVHQNFQINNYGNGLKKSADWATGQVNVLQMLLKHGILPVPYTCSIGDIDMISGIDVGRIKRNRSVAAVAISITKSGHLWGTTPSAEPQTGETISETSLRRMFSKMINDYEIKEQTKPSRLLLIRDGNTPPSEQMSLEKIINEYRQETEIDICWISIRKQGCPRLLIFENGQVKNEIPSKGYWLNWSDESAWIWTTGSPNLNLGLPGIPSGINFTIIENFAKNRLSIEDASKLLICHSHASQSQPYNSTRLPFVMHLADKQAKAMGNEEIPLNPNSNRFSAA